MKKTRRATRRSLEQLVELETRGTATSPVVGAYSVRANPREFDRPNAETNVTGAQAPRLQFNARPITDGDQGQNA